MTHIFVNVPTSDLERSKEFYLALGAELNEQFTDENAACVMWDENVFFMVLTKEFFATFTDKQIADTSSHAQALIGLSRESRDRVDETVTAGLAAGGTEPRDAQDYGFMYSRGLEDPDGNLLDFFFMEPSAVQKGTDA